MIAVSSSVARLAILSTLAGCVLPLTALAQAGGSGSGDASAADRPASADGRGKRGGGAKRAEITPYIEAGQIVTAELSPGDDVLTYSVIAAGVDASIAGANNAASVSVRYEHRFGWGRAEDGDTISGVARGYATVVPGVHIEAGGLAARTRIENDGAQIVGPLASDDSVSQVYSVYAGPSVSTSAGDVALTASYRIGYTKVEEPDSFVATPGAVPVDVFDDSVAQVASVRAAMKPYDVLPVGLGVGAGYYREDISNLDQRVQDFHARADVTVPVTPTFALVGGVGYENVEISGRDAVRDGAGNPVVGPGGRFVTDESEPRVLAYDVSGLIWDAGVIWRPSRRTALEAHVGHRYGSTTVYGTFAYEPNSRNAFNVAVYDNVAGFGGQVNRALVGLPDDFSAVRNPLTGDFGSCVDALEGGNCLAGALGSVRSATFRARGGMATYSLRLGRLRTGVGVGYDRRKYIAAPGTILASVNGTVDENFWIAAYLSGQIDERSSFSTNVYANWFQIGSAVSGDASAVGATAAYYRSLTRHLAATAALGIDGVNREAPLEDVWTASALLGVRYSF